MLLPTYRSYSSKDLRGFGTVMAAFFVLLGVLSLRHHGWHLTSRAPIWLAALGAWLVAARLAPWLLRPFMHVWMLFGTVMGTVMSLVILTVAFFLVVTPVGLLLRMFGKDLLDARFGERATYWRERRTAPPDHFKRLYLVDETTPRPPVPKSGPEA